MQQIEKESRGQRCQRRRSEPAPATPPHTKQKKKKRSSKNRYYTTRIPLPLFPSSVNYQDPHAIIVSVGRSVRPSQNPKKNFGISKHMIISKKIGFPKNKQKNWNSKKHYQDSPSLIRSVRPSVRPSVSLSHFSKKIKIGIYNQNFPYFQSAHAPLCKNTSRNKSYYLGPTPHIILVFHDCTYMIIKNPIQFFF